MTQPVSVLVVDDSAFMRKMVSEIVSEDPAFRVVGQARDGADALDKLPRLRPDVITLDVEMPVMGGLAFLEEIMRRQPTPVVMLSSLTQAGAEITVRCLERGAVDFVGKPSGAISLDIRKIGEELKAKLKMAAGVRKSALTPGPQAALTPGPQAALTPGTQAALTPVPSPASGRGVPGPIGPLAPRGAAVTLTSVPPRPLAGEGTGVRAAAPTARLAGVLLIGASTGGPRALQMVIPALPADLNVPIVIVQHMPPGFTASLANRLNAGAPFPVREAREGDALTPGVALVAPGGRHLQFDAHGIARLTDEPPIHGVRPAVDVTLASLARLCGARTVAVLLTGMGRDGARGLKAIRDLGGWTLAEDESTCVVYGMPKAAAELEAVDALVPLPQIASEIARLFAEPRKTTR